MDERVEGRLRGREGRIFLDGRPIRAYEGETIGAALHAAGVTSLSRSIKYHRPRGLFCMTGKCANCMMRVDGVPNVRVCTEPMRNGAQVKSQNAWPNARRDVLNASDKVFWKSFDHHDKFIRPRFMVRFFHWVVRRMAGFGSIPSPTMAPPRRPPIHQASPDLVVVGAGAAGLAASLAAADEGADVHLFEESGVLGGDLQLVDHKAARDLVERVRDHDRVTLHERTPVVGVYGDDDPTADARTVVAYRREGLLEMHPRGLVITTGTYETPPLFPANDLPGIMGVRAALILLTREGVLPGRTPVVLGRTQLAHHLVEALDAHGVEARHLPADAEVLRARGRRRVKSVEVRLDGRVERIPCDLLGVGGGTTPRPELLQQAGSRLAFDPARGGLVPVVDEEGATTSTGVWAAGEVTGVAGPHQAVEHGRRVGRAAARAPEEQVVHS